MNKSALIICSITGLIILAAVICFVVWQRNKNQTDHTSTFNNALQAINTQFDFGSNIYDVMLAGQRNDSTAAAGKSSGSLLGM